MAWMEAIEDGMMVGVTLVIHILELMGAVVIVIGAFRAFFNYFTHRHGDVRLALAQTMALGLEFKLGGEILRTMIVRDWSEILIVGAIILLRSLLNFLIHWEIKHLEHGGDHAAPAEEVKQ